MVPKVLSGQGHTKTSNVGDRAATVTAINCGDTENAGHDVWVCVCACLSPGRRGEQAGTSAPLALPQAERPAAGPASPSPRRRSK